MGWKLRLAAMLFSCVSTLAVAVPGVAAVPSPPGAVQNGAPGAGNEQGKAFIPSAGYAETADYIYRNRRIIEADPRPAAAPAPVTARSVKRPLVLKGTRAVPVILFEYEDVAHSFDPADYQTLLFAPDRPSLSRYYRENSFGLFRIEGKVIGWFKLPGKAADYEKDFANGPAFGKLLQEVLTWADSQIDFGEFDNDGPDGIANSDDDDGLVDTVVLVHPRVGSEARNARNGALASDLRSHSWHYDDEKFGHKDAPFVTRAVRNRTKPDPRTNADPSTFEHIKITDYTLQPGLSGRSRKRAPQLVEIGVFCHEFGHALNLPDLYDRNSPAKSFGVGNYCLMGYGMYGGDGNDPGMPAPLSAWCKAYLGWAVVEDLFLNRRFFLDPVLNCNRLYRVVVPGTERKEYFLLEYRSNNWADPIANRINWDKPLSVSGLAIWHIDERVGAAGTSWPMTEVNQGQNDSGSLPDGTPPSFPARHALISLIQKDGRLDLEKLANTGDATDFWLTGDSFNDDPDLRHGSRGFDNKPTGVRLSDIDLNAGSALFGISSAGVDGALNERRANEAVVLAATEPVAAPLRGAPQRPAVADAEPDPREILGKLDGLADDDAFRQGLSRTAKLFVDHPDVVQEAVIPEELRDKLKGIDTLKRYQLDQIDDGIQSDIKTIAQKLRSGEVTAETKAQTNVEKAIKALAAFDGGGKISYERAGKDAVGIVWGLSIPTEGRTKTDDAKQRLATFLPHLAGRGVEFDPEPFVIKNAVKVQQVYTMGDQKLPLFNKWAELKYDLDGTKLVGIVNDTVDSDELNVTGESGMISVDDARDVASKTTGYDASLLTEPKEGIYMADDNPSQGRVAVRFTKPGAGRRPGRYVYVDQATQRVWLDPDTGPEAH